MKALERRQRIIELLCQRRYDTYENLAFEFSISKTTIYRDILELSLTYPIFTERGQDGGVYIAEGYYLSKQYLSDEQKDLLELLKSRVNKNQVKILQSIINKFAVPNKKGGKNDD